MSATVEIETYCAACGLHAGVDEYEHCLTCAAQRIQVDLGTSEATLNALRATVQAIVENADAAPADIVAEVTAGVTAGLRCAGPAAPTRADLHAAYHRNMAARGVKGGWSA